MQWQIVIAVFSNRALCAPPRPTRLQKHSLQLLTCLSFPLLGPLCAGTALLQDLKVWWKVWGKECMINHPFPWCGSPHPRMCHPEKGAASNAVWERTVLLFSCQLPGDVDPVTCSGLEVTLVRLPGGSQEAYFPRCRGTPNFTSISRRSFSRKGCLPSRVPLLHCQSCSNKFQITSHTNTTTLNFFLCCSTVNLFLSPPPPNIQVSLVWGRTERTFWKVTNNYHF